MTMPTRREFLKTTAAIAASPYLSASAAAQQPSSTFDMFADFESGSYDGWTLEGDCWGAGPASEQTFTGRITGFQGKRFLCTLHPQLGANAVGRAISKEFRIERPFIDFLIGGGRYPGVACLNLRVDGKVACTATGADSPELHPACWDVSEWIGKTAHFEVVDSTRATARGYVMVDAIRLTDTPPFQELVTGQNAFFCFSKEDGAGREFQSIFATPDGRSRRALTDWCVDRVTERLARSVSGIDRSDVNQCARFLRSEVDRVLSQYQVRDALAKQLIAANACSALTALLTTYDNELDAFILKQGEKKDNAAYDYIINLRDPAVVLRRGKAVCSGISALEQRLALSLQDLGLECFVAIGYTRYVNDSPYKDVDHAWTLYYFAGKSMWAPSDTTRSLSVVQSAKTLPKGKLVRSALVVVDPLLRDMYTLSHFVQNCKVGHPGTSVNERVVNLTTYREWARFHETHPYILKSARSLVTQLDKEDSARLA
jgi:hypothetical protein